ncbi:hypothetical protein F4820DRAFT_437945 [Hypoxylon rubiginosum]|uniref:Uncharacterized protein n=1 Tax=Hypoxylon rubiginosum TaxID=110542 RepID=A0ACB9YKX2_9PEZI|nr:hypothetical protein F4820DRAFT_437945 [Hypoxylon rubiginosum]
MSNTDLQLVRAQLHHRNRYQCPWSKCFPHMYTDSKQPCAKSSFKDFSKLELVLIYGIAGIPLTKVAYSEHIRRYHSHKDLSSERPVSQFANVKWTEEEQTELEEEANGAGSGKRQKEEKQPKSSKGNSKRQKKEIPPESQPFFHMMTREQGDKFRAWQDRPDIKRMRDKEEKYWSLCRLLFEYEDDNMFNDLSESIIFSYIYAT